MAGNLRWHEEMQAYTDELRRLLAGRDLSPDTRARSIAALIGADSAQKMHTAAVALRDDTIPHFVSAAYRLSERLGDLPGY